MQGSDEEEKQESIVHDNFQVRAPSAELTETIYAAKLKSPASTKACTYFDEPENEAKTEQFYNCYFRNSSSQLKSMRITLNQDSGYLLVERKSGNKK